MALIVKDRVKETTTSTGTGTVILAGAQDGFQSFSVIGNGNTTYYSIVDATNNEWEIGLGTYTASGTTLSRDTILESSDGGTAVDFQAGSKFVFSTYPAEKAAFSDDIPTAVSDLTNDSGYLTSIPDDYVLTAGDTMTGALTLSGAPTANNHATTKEYVDGLIAAGIHYHDPVRVESPDDAGSLNATYSNGTNGVGATLTNAGTQAALVIDGVTLATSDRVLIYNQTNAFENGIYTVTNTGSASTNWVLTRATDADSYGLGNDSLSEGTSIFVLEGDDGAGEVYACTTTGTITFGTTAINFSQIGKSAVITGGTAITVDSNEVSVTDNSIGATQLNVSGNGSSGQVLKSDGDGTFSWAADNNTTYSAGSGLSLTGTTFANTAPDQTVSLTGSGATSISGTYPSFTISSTDTNTTYSAGSGLSLSGTTFSLASNANADTVDSLHASSFIRNDTSNSVTNYANKVTFFSNTNAATTSGSQASLECYSSGAGNDAFMAFHVGGDYATYFGLDGDTNDLFVGGWSKGASRYKIWHAANDGSGSGLDADTLDGIQATGFLYRDLTNSDRNLNFNTGGTNSGGGIWLGNSADTHIFNIYGDGSSTGFLKSKWGAWDLKKIVGGNLQVDHGGTLYTVWDSFNDGSGSGLDADTVDGIQGASFLRSDASDTCSGDISFTGGAGAVTITNSDIRSNASSNWTGDPGTQGKIQYHSNRWYIVADSSSNRIVQFRRNNSDKSYIDNNGKFIGTASSADNADTVDGLHASSFQPAANELTWVDQATGNYGTIKVDDDRGVTWAGYAIRDDWVFMSNGPTSAGIYNDTDNEWALYCTQNGSVELRANGTHEISAQNGYGYAPNSMRSPTFYDYNNTAYYVDPAGTSIVNDFRVDIMYDKDNTSYYARPGSTSKFNDLRANIFYDNNNTAYYADPASTSRFNAIEADGVHAKDGGDYFTFYGDNSANHSISSRDNAGNVSDDIRINSYGGVWINLDSNNNNTSSADFRIGRHGGTGNMTSYGLFDVYGDSLYVDSAYSFRSQIFYDRDNTSYYTNPASTSVLNDIYLEGEIYHNGDTNTYLQFHASDQFRVVTGGSERFEVNNSVCTVQNNLTVNGTATFNGTVNGIAAGTKLVGMKQLTFGGNRILNFIPGGIITLGTPVWMKVEHDGTNDQWRFNQNSSSLTQGWFYPVTTATNYSGNFTLTDDTTAGTTVIPTVAMTALNTSFTTVAGDNDIEVWVYHPNPTSTTFLQIWESGSSNGKVQIHVYQ